MLPRLIAILAAINIAFSINALEVAPANVAQPSPQPQLQVASQNFGALPSAIAALNQMPSFPAPQAQPAAANSGSVTTVPMGFTSSPAVLRVVNAPVPVAAAPVSAPVQPVLTSPPNYETKTAQAVTPLIVGPAPELAPAATPVRQEPVLVAPAPATNQPAPAQSAAFAEAQANLPPNLDQKTAAQNALDQHNLRLQQKGNVNEFNNVNARQISKDAAINRSFIAQTGNLNLANNVLLDQRQSDGKNLGWVVQRNNNNIANFANIRQVREGEGASFARVVQTNNQKSYNVAKTKQAFKNTSYGNVAVTASMKGLKSQVFAVKTQLIELDKNKTAAAKAQADAKAANQTVASAPVQVAPQEAAPQAQAPVPEAAVAPVAQDGQAPPKSAKLEKILQIQKEFFGTKAPAVAVAAPTDGKTPDVIMLQDGQQWVDPVQNPAVGGQPAEYPVDQQYVPEQVAPQDPNNSQIDPQFYTDVPQDGSYQGQLQESPTYVPGSAPGSYDVPLAEVIEPNYQGMRGTPVQESLMIGSALGSDK